MQELMNRDVSYGISYKSPEHGYEVHADGKRIGSAVDLPWASRILDGLRGNNYPTQLLAHCFAALQWCLTQFIWGDPRKLTAGEIRAHIGIYQNIEAYLERKAPPDDLLEAEQLRAILIQVLAVTGPDGEAFIPPTLRQSIEEATK